MPRDLGATYIYHITDVANLNAIIAAGGLFSDVALAQAGGPVVTIGYSHIKLRRMTQYRIPCTGNRFVGEFVPFYFCPRSPMLYTINRGNTGRPAGCQSSVLHLVSTVKIALDLGKPWAISDSNAGSDYAQFYDDPAMVDQLNWDAINTNDWRGVTTAKQAEFLVADFFPWSAIRGIGCQNANIQSQVAKLLAAHEHRPAVAVRANWYY